MPHIPDAKYVAQPLNPVVLAESKEKKTPYVVVNFLIAESGTTVTWRGFLTEKTQERTIEALRACGWTGTDIASVTFPPNAQVQIETETEEYEGKQHSKVKWVNAIRGPSTQGAMSEIEAKTFAAKMKGAILAFDARNKSQAHKNVAQAAQTLAGGDDIPF